MTDMVQLEGIAAQSLAPLPAADLPLEAFSYDARPVVLAALGEELMCSGCWLLERRSASFTQVQLRFEMQLRAVVELYAGLLAAGLQLTRGSHMDLTSFCTLRKFRGRDMASVVTVTLSVTFLEELTATSVLGTGTAFA
jgi:hypothetical protein